MSDVERGTKFKELNDSYSDRLKGMESAFKQLEASVTKLWEGAAAYKATEVYSAGPVGADNVVGVGYGHRVRAGRRTAELCLKTYVIEKYPENEILAEALAPKMVGGVAVDVEAVGELVAWGGNRKAKWRPAPGGVSVGHVKITAGTLGCYCTALGLPRPLFILSNNHVLANENAAKVGDAILQPGPYDGGRDPRDRIAKLSCFVPIDFTGGPNYVDAALAAPLKPSFVKPCIQETTSKCTKQDCVKVKGVAAPILGTRVKKSGRTTASTCGAITGVGVTAVINYGSGKVAKFVNQVIITPGGFSAGGDSGSLIMDMRNRARALLFAGSPTNTIANPIQTVLQQLSKKCRLRGLTILDC